MSGISISETFCTAFFRQLRKRGLSGVRLVISHEGLKAFLEHRAEMLVELGKSGDEGEAISVSSWHAHGCLAIRGDRRWSVVGDPWPKPGFVVVICLG